MKACTLSTRQVHITLTDSVSRRCTVQRETIALVMLISHAGSRYAQQSPRCRPARRLQTVYRSLPNDGRYLANFWTAPSEAELQELVDRLDQVSRKYSLLINVDKTKVGLAHRGERRHSVPHTHSEWTTGAGGYVPIMSPLSRSRCVDAGLWYTCRT